MTSCTRKQTPILKPISVQLDFDDPLFFGVVHDGNLLRHDLSGRYSKFQCSLHYLWEHCSCESISPNICFGAVPHGQQHTELLDWVLESITH